ncbi:MAG: ExbD/TolR family protein [Candidatus Aminicenantia bacterium]
MAIEVGGEEIKSEPNVVPLCDVLLVLLIIFMVVTPMLQKGVDVRLPVALNTVNQPENPEVVLAMKRDGRIYLNQTQVTLDNLTSMIEEAFSTEGGEKKIYIKADADLEYGKIVEVFNKVKEAGLEVMGIITEVKTKSE